MIGPVVPFFGFYYNATICHFQAQDQPTPSPSPSHMHGGGVYVMDVAPCGRIEQKQTACKFLSMFT